jgi:hypothetical protein
MPATLTNDRFELYMSVADYEFPDIVDNPYDANWLLIRLGLQSLHGAWNWQVIDAGALTWELEACTTWFQNLSTNQPVETESFGFSEPDIRFETIRNEDNLVIGLSVNLMDEFQPPTKVLKPYEQNIATLRFHTPSDVLESFANSLSEEVRQFPQRGERPSV